MDPKKQQSLTPELKQIYERVMNTQVNQKPEGAIPAAQVPEPRGASPTSVLPPIGGATASTAGQSPSGSAPPPPPTTPATVPPPIGGGSNEGFLSSGPPHPIADTKPFAFTGNKITSPKVASVIGAQVGITGGRKISGKIVALLVVVLIVAWALFWVKFFGLI